MIQVATIQRNLESVRRRMAEAARKSGRAPDQVKLVAVTKTVGLEEIRALAELGVRDFGENRVQEALRKMEALKDLDVDWHMIGRLQTNKVNKAAGRFVLIHSVDSVRLAQALERAADRLNGLHVDALIEINVSGEESKGGLRPDELPPALDEIGALSHMRISGLMTMAPIVEDPEAARPIFRRLREVRDKCARGAPANVDLRRLSMGMTQDFEVAIEEGADIVRIGTALFREG